MENKIPALRREEKGENRELKREKKKKETCPPEERAYRRRRKIISLISIAGVLLVFAIITCTVGQNLLDFVADPQGFREWADDQGILGRLVLVGIVILQVIVAIMPGEVVEVGAGYAFGAVEGMLLCLIGTAAGSSLIYWITKKFGYHVAEAFITREKINSLSFIKNSKRLNVLIFILFFIPGTPKDLITYFIGLTPMRLPAFLLISILARIPSVITSTVTGNALGTQDYHIAIAVFLITAAVSGIGLLIYSRISQRGNQAPAAEERKAS